MQCDLFNSKRIIETHVCRTEEGKNGANSTAPINEWKKKKTEQCENIATDLLLRAVVGIYLSPTCAAFDKYRYHRSQCPIPDCVDWIVAIVMQSNWKIPICVIRPMWMWLLLTHSSMIVCSSGSHEPRFAAIAVYRYRCHSNESMAKNPVSLCSLSIWLADQTAVPPYCVDYRAPLLMVCMEVKDRNWLIFPNEKQQ